MTPKGKAQAEQQDPPPNGPPGQQWEHPNYGRATEPPWVTIAAGEGYHVLDDPDADGWPPVGEE